MSNPSLRLRKLLCILSRRKFLISYFRCRVVPSLEHLEVMRSVSGLRSVVDIGANRGQFSLLIQALNPRSRIFAFEPLSAPSTIYRTLFKANPLVVLRQFAIGEHATTTEAFVSLSDDSSSLLPISDLQSDLFPGTGLGSREPVSVNTLDSFLSAGEILRPSLLKLDVQGYELNALKGCETLLKYFDYIYCECSFVELYEGQSFASEVISWLDSRGFSLEGVYNVYRDSRGVSIQADFLFVLVA